MQQSFIWRHFHIAVPDDWEMLLFTKDFDAGRCTFADRYQHRLELNWLTVPGAPDFTRMMRDYSNQLRELNEDGNSVLQAQVGNWHGVVARTGEILTSRFGTYFETGKCLFEAVFLWPDRRDAGLEQRILRSVHEEPETDDGYYRWRAFGLDLQVSAELELRECKVQPGYASMRFSRPNRDWRYEQFERYGFVSEWLKVPIADWLRKQTPRGVRITQTESVECEGYQVERVIGVPKQRNLLRIIGGKEQYMAEAWLCPTDGRIMCVMRQGPVNAIDWEHRQLSWCMA